MLKITKSTNSSLFCINILYCTKIILSLQFCTKTRLRCPWIYWPSTDNRKCVLVINVRRTYIKYNVIHFNIGWWSQAKVHIIAISIFHNLH